MKIGICYRPHLHKKFLNTILDNISILEIMPEVTNVADMREITDLCLNRDIDMGLHCLRTSLFSPEGVQTQMLERYFIYLNISTQNIFQIILLYHIITNII